MKRCTSYEFDFYLTIRGYMDSPRSCELYKSRSLVHYFDVEAFFHCMICKPRDGKIERITRNLCQDDESKTALLRKV